MKTKTRLEIVICLVVIIAAAVSVGSFARECENVRGDVLRLHVVANSDSETDQALKLMVRDAVLKKGGELFDGTVTAQSAQTEIVPHIDELTAAAQTVLSDNGCDAQVKITIADEFFNTRCYESFTMPAGVYTAVRVNIGSAKGHNWWCVMFPPLCLPAASADADAFFTDGEMKVISASPEYEPRFKIVEIFEKIKNKVTE